MRAKKSASSTPQINSVTGFQIKSQEFYKVIDSDYSQNHNILTKQHGNLSSSGHRTPPQLAA